MQRASGLVIPEPGDGPFREPEPGSLWTRTIFTPTYDPLDVIQTAFMVKTKTARIVPFNLFETQKRFIARMSHKNVEVKPRQVGSSTLKLAIATAIACTTPNINILIISHRDDTTESFRETIKFFINTLNEHHGMGIEVGRANEDMLEIRSTGSWFFFGSSRAPGVGRSRTIHILLASELAYWEGMDPGKELGGMTESMPDNALEFVESTPNGAEGPFYEIYHGDTTYTKHFFPWFIEPSRRLRLPPGTELTYTAEEQQLVTMHGLDAEQIAWRRAKWKDLEAKKLYFPQEYPEDDQTCFMAGIKSVFQVEQLTELMRHAKIALYADYDRPGMPWDPGGTLRIWKQPRVGSHYVVACDVGGGHKDGDLSYAVVREIGTGDHVASLFGHWDPDSFSDLTVDLARYYNQALLAHESTGLGEAAVRRATNHHAYPNYYYEQRGNSDDWVPGFNVSANSRAQILARMVDEFVTSKTRTYDVNILRQMTSARWVRKKFVTGARDVIEVPDVVHDDGMMAYAQSCMLLEQPVLAGQRDKPRRGQ